MLRRLKQSIRRQTVENDNSTRDHQSGPAHAQPEESGNASKNEGGEMINSARRDGQSAEENDNAREKPQQIPMEVGSYSRPLSPHKTNEKNIDGSLLSLNRSPKKKKFRISLFGKDIEYDQIGSPHQWLSRNERSRSEPTIRDKEWQEALRFRLNQSEEQRKNRKQEGKEESEEKKQRRREIHQALEKNLPDIDVAACILKFKTPCSDLDAKELIVKDLYGMDNSNKLFTFEQKMPRRMLDGDRWKRTDVRFKTDGISQSFEAKEPRAVTHRSHIDEKRPQSSASIPCNTEEQLISRPNWKEKYGYLPHFHEGLQSSLAAGFFGNSEKIEGFLVGGREKLQEIRGQLDSYCHACCAHEINEKAEFNNDSLLSCSCESSTSTSYSSDQIHENDFIDHSVYP